MTTTQATTGSGTFEVINPATGEVTGSYPVHAAAEVAAAVAQARRAQRWWEALGFGGRQPYLRRWLRWLALHCDEVYEIGYRETARPRADVQFELYAGLEDVRWAAVHARRVLRERRVAPGIAMMNFDARLSYRPLGVIGVITPWNAPVYLTLSGMAAALAAGNAVVVLAVNPHARVHLRLGFFRHHFVGRVAGPRVTGALHRDPPACTCSSSHRPNRSRSRLIASQAM